MRTLFRQAPAIERVVNSTMERLLDGVESMVAAETKKPEAEVTVIGEEAAVQDGAQAKRSKPRVIGGGRKGAAKRRQYRTGQAAGDAAVTVAILYKIDRSMVLKWYAYRVKIVKAAANWDARSSTYTHFIL